jgi:hypothetical protein
MQRKSACGGTCANCSQYTRYQVREAEETFARHGDRRMDVRPGEVEVYIGELSVQQPASIDSWIFRNALQRELTRLLGTAPQSENGAIHAANSRTVDSIAVESRGSGVALEAEVARAIYRELQK